MRILFLIILVGLVGCSGNGGEGPPGPNPSPTPAPTPPPNMALAGVAPYALQHSGYDCDALIRSINESGLPELRYAWLYPTFDNHPGGNGAWLECVYKLNALPITRAMQTHLRNEVCDRNKNCGSYEQLSNWGVKDPADYQKKLLANDPNLTNHLRNHFAKARDLIFPALRQEQACYISYGLESNLNEQAYIKLMQIGKEFFEPRCRIVYNPIGDRNPIPGTLFEKHGSQPSLKAPCVANLDGKDVDFDSRNSEYPSQIHESQVPDYVRRYQHCDMVLLWIAEDNCRRPGAFIDPRNRPAKYCPSYEIQKERAKYLVVPK